MVKKREYHRQGVAVCQFLLYTLKEELQNAKRPAAFAQLVRVLSDHETISDMIGDLLRDTQKDHATILRGVSGSYEVPIQHLQTASTGLADLSTKYELVEQLKRVQEILRQTYDVIVDESLGPEDCSILALVSYGRILEKLNYPSAVIGRVLALEGQILQVLRSQQ